MARLETMTDAPTPVPRLTDPASTIKLVLALGVVAAAFLYSLAQLGIDFQRVIDGFGRFGQFAERAFPPDAVALGRLWQPAIETVQVAFIGTAIGIVLSLFLGALAAKNLAPARIVSIALKGSFGLVRAVPALIWALLFIVAVGLGPLPGILALAVNSVGMLGKIFSETFEEVDRGVVEALRATGAGWGRVFLQGVVPETLPRLLSWSIFRLDINVRYSAILGIVGAGGIGWELTRASRMGDYASAVTVTLVIFAIVFAIELITDRLRRWVL